jgi:signal transduction histidine kinase/ActR/RegA family two-component response regulator
MTAFPSPAIGQEPPGKNAAVHAAPPPDLDILQTLKQRVVKASLGVLTLAMPLVGAIFIVNRIRTGEPLTMAVAVTAAMIVLPILRLLLPVIGFQRVAVGLVCFLALIGFVMATRGILTAAYGTLCVLTIQMAALCFGRRGAIAGVAAIGSLHMLAWMLVSLEVVPPLSPTVWDPRSTALWLRQLVVIGFLGSVIAVGQLYVVEQLARSLTVHRDLAAREKAQRLALEEAERLQRHEREQRAHTQQLLEKSRRVEALARVAGSVAHDFNNVLTVIMGTAEAAKIDSRSPDEVEAYMDEIVDAAVHAATLTNQLLTLGRQQLLRPNHYSMTALLTRLRPAMGRVLPADVALVLDLPDDDATVYVDETGFDRTVINLVLNARDAMPRGGSITISSRREVSAGDPQLADGPCVSLQVADSGIGMDAETLERVFEPFFSTKGERGTGLGLASVYAFVKDAGGAIAVSSTPDLGTTFTLRFPEAAGPAMVPSSGNIVEEAAGRSRRDRILLVEDRDDVRSTMRRTLIGGGFDVREAASADEAVTILEGSTTFSLMCIDGVMPGLSTAAAIERARVLAPAMQVIVCSGHVQEDLLRRGIETGRYEILQKPFAPSALLARVRQVLTRHDSGRRREGLV